MDLLPSSVTSPRHDSFAGTIRSGPAFAVSTRSLNTLSGANRLGMAIGSDLEPWRNRIQAFETFSVPLTTDAMLAGTDVVQGPFGAIQMGRLIFKPL